jgi:prepilin peptidase CpaA
LLTATIFCRKAGINLALHDLALILLSISAVYLDLTRKKIPNLLTLPFIAIGLLYHLWTGGWAGLFFSLVGLAAGLGLLLLPFATGGIGGGDVKYLGAVGALQGAGFTLATLIIGAGLGGICALVLLAVKGRLGITLRRLGGLVLAPLLRMIGLSLKSDLFFRAAAWFSPPPVGEEQPLTFPYGVPIAIGALLVLSGLAESWLPGLFFRQ